MPDVTQLVRFLPLNHRTVYLFAPWMCKSLQIVLHVQPVWFPVRSEPTFQALNLGTEARAGQRSRNMDPVEALRWETSPVLFPAAGHGKVLPGDV